MLGALGPEPTAVHALAEGLRLPVNEVVRLLEELRDFGLVAGEFGVDHIRCWRRLDPANGAMPR